MSSHNRQLKLIIQPKIIDHLGIKMYQKHVDVVSEYIANGWDADSEISEITITEDSICIKDNGLGMTFEQCQNYFLTVGRDRRESTGKEVSEEKRRPVLGRKGIGKFAGFGVAKKVEIETIAKESGEKTAFEMDITNILEHDANKSPEKPITIISYDSPNEGRKENHGTIITLKEVETDSINMSDFNAELSRRFLLAQTYDDFIIKVNGSELPKSFDEEMEFVFPRDLNDNEVTRIGGIDIDDNGWAIEQFGDHLIKWRIGFYEGTIQIEELRGISIYARGKLAQKPFFFDLSGGISGQHALEYMTGQVQMDFIDDGGNDLIATERQRINLQTKLGKEIRDWGIERIKLLSSIWKNRRSEKRLQEISDKISPFHDRLNNLPKNERKTVESVLKKIATFPKLGQARFKEWTNDILTSWEAGRLRNLIDEMSKSDNFDEQTFLDFLSEAGVLTSLNIAESIKTKIVAIGELKKRVAEKQLENQVRDYVYENPWLIHPKWESFKKERSVRKIIEDMGREYLSDETYNGRVDLALSSGSTMLLLEFMRPGLTLNIDHLDRINHYVMEIRDRLKAETGHHIDKLETAYVIADNRSSSTLVNNRVQELSEKGILVMSWDTLIEQAISQWEEHLDILKSRFPGDDRIQQL